MKEIFSKTRIRLSFWYFLILLFILLFFSIFIYKSQEKNFTKIIFKKEFGGHIPRKIDKIEREEITYQIKALKENTIFNLIIINNLILILGFGLSFFLADKTLAPIKKNSQIEKEFLATVSHELRNPLAVLQTLTEVNLRGKNKTKKEYKQVLSQINEEMKRFANLVNDLLFISRASSKVLKLKFEKINLSQILAVVLLKFESVFKLKKIIVLKKIEKNIFTIGDSEKIKQLFFILIDNAVKYSANKISIIKIRLIKNKAIIFTIKDNGLGISKDDLPHIFERFYKGKLANSQSSGLGLFIADWIVKEHRGNLRVESETGKGSKFEIKFKIRVNFKET